MVGPRTLGLEIARFDDVVSGADPPAWQELGPGMMACGVGQINARANEPASSKEQPWR